MYGIAPEQPNPLQFESTEAIEIRSAKTENKSGDSILGTFDNLDLRGTKARESSFVFRPRDAGREN
jgi:hypothetical protein